MFYKFEVGHNTAEAMKNNFCMKGERAFDHSNQMKFCLNCKNLDDQVRSSRPKTMNSEAVLPTMKRNLVRNIWKVSGELGISQSQEVCHLNDLGKSIWR